MPATTKPAVLTVREPTLAGASRGLGVLYDEEAARRYLAEYGDFLVTSLEVAVQVMRHCVQNHRSAAAGAATLLRKLGVKEEL